MMICKAFQQIGLSKQSKKQQMQQNTSLINPSAKLQNIQEEKKRLKERIQQIEKTEINEIENKEYDVTMAKLLERKQILEQEKRQEQAYKQMENQYIERRKYMEKEKQLQKIKNQKRIIQLEVGMKRIVFEGIKQKVKGVNSEQLMIRGLLAAEDQENNLNKSRNPFKRNKNGESSNLKEQFEGYLMKENDIKQKGKYNIQELNEKRMDIFEKKQQMIMRQILLKEMVALDNPPEMDVMSMTKEELEHEIQSMGINLDQFIHPIHKEDILEHFQDIKQKSKERIAKQKDELDEIRKQNERNEVGKRMLRESLNNFPFKDIQVIKRLLYDLFDEVVIQFQKRHSNRSEEDQYLKSKILQQEYIELLEQNLIQEESNKVIDQMIKKIKQEMIKDAVEEISKTHEYVHHKTEDCFKFLFDTPHPIAKQLADTHKYNILLNFKTDGSAPLQNQFKKKDNFLQSYDQKETNIYQTEQSTTTLINDIALLDLEEKYFEGVKAVFKNQKQIKNEDLLFHYDQNTLFVISKNGIEQLQAEEDKKKMHRFTKRIESMIQVKKCNKSWLIRSKDSINLITPWNRQEFTSSIGQRISNPCGAVSCIQFYPVLTLLGNTCSALIGFEKGQVLKYNYNMNRLTSKQTNITHYQPVLQPVKTGQEPPFSLENRNVITYETEKLKANDSIHEFRQFFDYHSESIILMQFLGASKFLTVDKQLKCALWQYSKERGLSSYEPIFKFEIRSSYSLYKEDENPRFQDIYPSKMLQDTPEQVYQKYMQTQSFLKNQIYNNPKKQIAYFKSNLWDQSQHEKPIWKITYDDKRKTVNKIIESFYEVLDGKIEAISAKLQHQTLFVLVEREHVLRTDLKTVKIYSWNFQQKKLGRIGIELDLYTDQKVHDFIVMGKAVKSLQDELITILSSGRILIFSLVTGQLLKNLNDESSQNQKMSKYYYKNIIHAFDKDFFYAVTSSNIIEISLQDLNGSGQRNKINQAIEIVRRKYLR